MGGLTITSTDSEAAASTTASSAITIYTPVQNTDGNTSQTSNETTTPMLGSAEGSAIVAVSAANVSTMTSLQRAAAMASLRADAAEDAAMLAAIDSMHEDIKEGNAVLSQIGASADTDSIMGDATAHRKRSADALKEE